MNTPDFSIHTNRAGVMTLERAILLYRGDGQRCATVHDIAIIDDTPTILAGKAIHSGAVHALARGLRQVAPAGFLPAELLWHDGERMLWWLPGGRRHMTFRVPEFGDERSAVLPHPPLVFLAAPRAWAVWALRERQRPTPETALFQAPFFNVSNDGHICAGTGELPARVKPELLEAWNRAFFSSAFSHPGTPKRLLSYPGGPYAFWQAMLDGKFPRFPLRVLEAANTATLGTLIALQQGGKHGRSR